MQLLPSLPEGAKELMVSYKITTTTLKCIMVKFEELIMQLLAFKFKIHPLIALESFLKFKELSSELSLISTNTL